MTAVQKKRPSYSYRRKFFYTSENKFPNIFGNIDEINSVLSIIGNGHRFHATCHFMDEHRPNVGMTTVQRALKRGFLNTELWVYVNPMVEEFVVYKGTPRTKWSLMKGHNNFVIDLDKFPLAETVEELEAHLEKIGVPIPYITQTGPRNFHLAFFTKDEKFTKQKRIELAMRIAQVPQECLYLNPTKAYAAFAKYGVDLHYLSMDIYYHKIRIPGTVNWKYDDPVNGKFVCKSNFFTGKAGKLDDYEHVSIHENRHLAESKPAVNKIDPSIFLNQGEPEKKKVKLVKLSTADGSLVRKVSDMLAPVIGKKVSLEMARMFKENITFLKKNNLAISQKNLAQRLGVTQVTVSRIIKKLVKEGFLSISDSYYNFNPANGKIMCRVYGAGIRLREELSKKVTRKSHIVMSKVESLKTDYSPGVAHNQYLQDIRDLYFLHVDPELAMKFIKLKNQVYTESYWKKRSLSTREVEKAIESFSEYATNSDAGRFRLKSPFDITSLICELEKACTEQPTNY